MNARSIGVLTACLLAGTTITAASPTNTMTTPRSQKAVDPATGLAIVMTTAAPGTALFELSDGRVTIRKDVRLGRSVTTIASGADQLVIAIDRTSVAVVGPAGEAVAAVRRPEEMGAVMRLVAASRAAKDAASLLGRMRLDEKTVAGQALILTKALLQSAAGNRAGTAELVSWTKGIQPSSARMVLARTGPSPAECWDQYAKEAIRIATEYVNCFNDTHWYNLIDRSECAILYDIEAEGAWLWYLNCVGAPIPSIRIG
jgi:hypothetical protein